MRDTDGRTVPEWRRKAVLPPDFRKPADDPDSPYSHPENFPPSRMWHGYFDGDTDPARCASVDSAIVSGKCVMLGAVAGTFTVEQIIRQTYGKR